MLERRNLPEIVDLGPFKGLCKSETDPSYKSWGVREDPYHCVKGRRENKGNEGPFQV